MPVCVPDVQMLYTAMYTLWIHGFFLKYSLLLALFFSSPFLLQSSFIQGTKGKFLWESEVTATIIEFTTQKKKKKSVLPFVF